MKSSSSPLIQVPGGPEAGAELELGVLGRPHGVRGALHMRLHNPDSDAFDTLKRLLIETERGGREELRIASVEARPKSWVLTFQGVATREQAEVLTGRRVFALRSELPALAEGEYYLMDLIGCRVYLGAEEIGRVSGVRGDPTVDTMIIELVDGTLVEQPVLPVWVQDVRVAEGRVVLASTEGFVS